MSSPWQNEPPVDKKYDPSASQWMREATESRLTIEELKAHNDKLQRELYNLNSRVGLIYECLGDLHMTDRVGDLMQKKLRDFQSAQHARQNPLPSGAFSNSTSPRLRRPMETPKPDVGVICGSNAFHQTAAYSSSYEGQVARETFNRRTLFDADEAQYGEKFDIFGKAKLPPSTVSGAPTAPRRGDAIDSFLTGTTPKPQPQPQPFGAL